MDDNGLLDLYLLLTQLKEEPRAGWQHRNIRGRTESVAEHSWMVAMIVLAQNMEPLRKLKALELALTHDVPEIITGDLTPADGVPKSEKHAREELAMNFVKALAPGELTATLEARLAEYNCRDTIEARLVHAADKVEAAIQAQRYYITNPTNTKLDDFCNDLKGLDLCADRTLTALHGSLHRNWGPKKWPFKFVLLIGGPGSGKGTVCEHIKERHQSVESISLGEQLRQEVQDTQSSFRDFIDESFSKGIAVPAILAMKIFQKRMERSAREGKTTVILDGFPRSTKQLQAFEKEISAQYVTVYLECTPEILACRLGARARSSGRVDDEDETVRLKRATDYNRDASAIIKLLSEKQFHKVDASQTSDLVAMEVEKCLHL